MTVFDVSSFLEIVVKKFVDRILNVVNLYCDYERCHRDSKAKNYALVTEKNFLSYGEKIVERS